MSSWVHGASGLTFTIPRPMSHPTIGAFARVDASSRRRPVSHAALPSSARASGSTLRISQHASVSTCQRLSGVDLRRDHAQVEVVALTDLVDVPERLGEVVLRVEEHHLDLGRDLHRDVDEHAVLERRREHGLVLVASPTPSAPPPRPAGSPGRPRPRPARPGPGPVRRVGARRPPRRRGGSSASRVMSRTPTRRPRRRRDRSRRSRRRSRVRLRAWGNCRGRRAFGSPRRRRRLASSQLGERLAGVALAGELPDHAHDGLRRPALAGSLTDFSPNSISMLPTRPPSSMW